MSETERNKTANTTKKQSKILHLWNTTGHHLNLSTLCLKFVAKLLVGCFLFGSSVYIWICGEKNANDLESILSYVFHYIRCNSKWTSLFSTVEFVSCNFWYSRNFCLYFCALPNHNFHLENATEWKQKFDIPSWKTIIKYWASLIEPTHSILDAFFDYFNSCFSSLFFCVVDLNQKTWTIPFFRCV